MDQAQRDEAEQAAQKGAPPDAEGAARNEDLGYAVGLIYREVWDLTPAGTQDRT